MIHYIKIWPRFYHAVKSGEKTFEIRINDRAYQKGDRVVQRYFDPQSQDEDYSDIYKDLTHDIGFVYQIDDKRVAFSLLPISAIEDKTR